MKNNVLKWISLATAVSGLYLGINNISAHADDNAQTTQQSTYNEAKTLYRTKFHFYKEPNSKYRLSSAKYDKGKKFKLTRIAQSSGGITYVKTNKGWINQNAFTQYVTGFGNMDYSMKVVKDDAALYNKPYETAGAKKIGSTSSLGIFNQEVKVNGRAETNLRKGYYRFNYNGRNYYIRGKYLEFNLAGLSGSNKKIETAFKAGYKLYGKSPYAWGKGRTVSSVRMHQFDCSSFVHYMYSKAGVRLGAMSSASTYTLKNMGSHVNYKHMKRGDIFFFDDKSEGKFCHVAFYLGNGLFIHDSPSADTGGVGISSLNDPHWSSRFNHYVRRVVY
ncbi:NlpC/P60 family protein [Apilactobacillus apisilvae]|uniref:NlpC/P60 family protein n=1 Tax=Apilactobacillus apisilvae TaxID=2923364 RepID=A0ABY4PGI9_9LACO|nr:NlpC/P60 family protein [Apilactobacillus apisilvae]UQS84926.1 NlpC/P60 family protein [Apilactobacillus apisilvae]